MKPQVDRVLIRIVSVVGRGRRRLVTGTTRLGDDLGHLVDLPLGTAESTELRYVSIRRILKGEGREGRGDENVPSSLRDGGHACPWSYGAIR